MAPTLKRSLGDFASSANAFGTTIPAGNNVPAAKSEDVFRKWEHDILLELCTREQVVISTGGGAPCHNDMMQIMNAHGATVYIELNPEALKTRLQHSRTERPLIKGKTDADLLNYIKSKLAEREYYYTQARHRIDGVNLKAGALITLLQG